MSAAKGWTPTRVTIQCSTGPLDATAYLHRKYPGLALVDRGGEWTVTHAASGYAVGPKGASNRAEIGARSDAVAFLIRVAPLADWTQDFDTLVAQKATLAPLVRKASASVFGAMWDDDHA